MLVGLCVCNLEIKIKLKYILTVVVMLGLFFAFQEQIFMSLSEIDKTHQQTFRNIKSISNITTDASNLERINRWNCAVRMFEENLYSVDLNLSI